MSYAQQPPPQTPPPPSTGIPSPLYPPSLQHHPSTMQHNRTVAQAAAMANAAAQSNAFFGNPDLNANMNPAMGMTRTGTTPNVVIAGMTGAQSSSMIGLRSGSQGLGHSQSHSHGHSQSHGGGTISDHTHGHSHSNSSPSLHHLTGVPTTPTLSSTNTSIGMNMAGVAGSHAHRTPDAHASLAAQQLSQSHFANPGISAAMPAPMPSTTGTAGIHIPTPPQMAGVNITQPPPQVTPPPSIPHTAAQTLAPPSAPMQTIHATIPAPQPAAPPMSAAVQPPIPHTTMAPPQQQQMQPEETPLYVNAKQFHRIIKRRTARALLEEQLRRAPGSHAAATGKAGRRPYLHESRHNHAMRRPRGPGGRFLTAEEVAAREKHAEADSKERTESADRETAGENGLSKRRTSESISWGEGESKKPRVDEG
ncbi:Transcriptional activator [Ascosphaera aggregata]|nr:Transcriptional activator [Ascosphaera aggregata]